MSVETRNLKPGNYFIRVMAGSRQKNGESGEDLIFIGLLQN